jgi:hypothetical protein
MFTNVFRVTDDKLTIRGLFIAPLRDSLRMEIQT